MISSPELENRCGGGWRWEPASGTAIDQASGPTVATGLIDNDGNAVFVFKGASCGAGTSTVTADVDAGTHTTYSTTYTIDAPAVTRGRPGHGPDRPSAPSPPSSPGRDRRRRRLRASGRSGHDGDGQSQSPGGDGGPTPGPAPS